MNKNFIVLNGKRYDATTGALLGTVSDSQFTPIKKQTKSTHHTAKIKTDSMPVTKKPKVDRTHHIAPKPAVRKTAGSKTLMRSAVRKSKTTQTKINSKQYPLPSQTSTIKPKLSVTNIDSGRLDRARQVDKSAKIGRFNAVTAPKITPRVKPLAVVAPKSIAQKPKIELTTPAHQTKSAKDNLFEKALQNAKSHEQPAIKTKSRKNRSKQRRLLRSVASLSAVLVIGGSIIFINKSSVELQLASVRAGFQASAPGYSPTGYQKQATETSKGKVAMRFVSPLDKNNFTLTQESSDWDSQTLFDSIVAENSNSYQTILSGGRTIYLYGENKAAWVDGGILYHLDGNPDLSKDQISSLASSM